MERAVGASSSLWRLSLCQLPRSSGSECPSIGQIEGAGAITVYSAKTKKIPAR